MQTGTSDGGYSFEYIDEHLREQRYKILQQYKQNPAIEMTSRDARIEGINSQKYHLDQLADWGLLEVTGSTTVGAGSDADTFALTEKGQKYLTRLDDDTEIDVGNLDEHVENLQQRVNSIEDGVEHDVSQLQGRVSKMHTTIHTLLEVLGEHEPELAQEISDEISERLDETS